MKLGGYLNSRLEDGSNGYPFACFGGGLVFFEFWSGWEEDDEALRRSLFDLHFHLKIQISCFPLPPLVFTDLPLCNFN